MIFNKIVGHSRQSEALKHSALGQAYVFSGPSGIGKKLVALACAQKLLCASADAPCGVCGSCLRVEKVSHPDLMVVQTDEAIIKIEQIRQIQNFANLKSFEKHGKVIIIDDAHKMNAQSANALLKTLEEPPENCHFFLVTGQKGLLLTTILSRCQKIGFGCLTTEEILKISPAAPTWALELCQGRLDLLNQWTDEDKKEIRKNLLMLLRNLPSSNAYEAFESLEVLSEERETALFASLLCHHWLKQALAHKLGLETKGNAEEKEVFNILASKLSADEIMLLSSKLQKLESDITANVNRRLAFEQYWLEAHEYAQ